jgi:hypothetical protein
LGKGNRMGSASERGGYQYLFNDRHQLVSDDLCRIYLLRSLSIIPYHEIDA